MAEPVPNLTVIVERGCHPDEVEAIINSINRIRGVIDVVSGGPEVGECLSRVAGIASSSPSKFQTIESLARELKDLIESCPESSPD